MCSSRCYIIFLFCFILAAPLFAQDKKDDLEKKRKEILKEIEEVQKILNETQSEKKANLGELRAISKQIDQRKVVIKTISREINYLNEQITEDVVVIESLESDLEQLKKEYASMVYASYKAGNAYNRLTFLFSSSTFNQFVMRLKYMEQYSEARKNQFNLINDVKKELLDEKTTLESSRVEKEKLLAAQVSENKKLLQLKIEQDKVLGELKGRESELEKKLAEKQRDVDKFNNLIAKIVNIDVDKTKAKITGEELKKLQGSFEVNKSKLPWPVNSGFISEHFGINDHPVNKRLKIPNNGVSIQTQKDAEVHAVFDGVVSGVAAAPGDYKIVVIVQHGNYRTVYAKLKEANVKINQVIKANDVIGSVLTNSEGISELQFEVWRDFEMLDPELWLVKK